MHKKKDGENAWWHVGFSCKSCYSVSEIKLTLGALLWI